MPRAPELIVALDVSELREAERLVRLLRPAVDFFKVGSALFTACGPDAVRMVRHHGARVFLDLKFFDIPQVVAAAVRHAARLGVSMLTVHILGGERMLRAAAQVVEEAESPPRLIGVTLLTSLDEEEVRSVGITDGLAEAVLRLGALARKAGLDGAVCGVQEVATLKQHLGTDFLTVVPGVRPRPVEGDDQARTGDFESAVAAGADYVVVGRPVLRSPDPLAAARTLVEALTSGRP
ncbi:MAG: orotidine-5'-phosphate decarboxylase [Armatimonadota bacterium]|nr:orotidine-5'-phosphate decarboxylase [Armatimonadota bacterium]MDR7443909.1 orotidine-5'-phosphate decarboxylase [Armatimonadota bacterium]MDR7570433.1 orotidine-5'-phosphate decarboxylase [Armatimonadota bacterium]MDR7613232.1 orotidine-5'-phosphate decarboxylase [Armatimonadota bacterium]